MIIVISLRVVKAILAFLVFVLAIYAIKPRFRNRTKIRYIIISEADGKYTSETAFWKVKRLRQSGLKGFFYTNRWSFIPLIPVFVKIGRVYVLPKFNIGKKSQILFKTTRDIKKIVKVNPDYHFSSNQRVDLRVDSRRLLGEVPCKKRSAALDYGRSYLLIFDDDMGYAVKLRENRRRKRKKVKKVSDELL